MNRFYKSAAAYVAVVAALLLSTAAVRAQVLQQIPGDALMVVKINKLSAVNDKAAALAKQFGIVEMNPDAGDPLGALLTAGGIKEGIDRAGDAAIAILNGEIGAGEPQVIAVIPVSDYAAFLKNFGDAQKDGELDVVHMSTNGKKDDNPTYVAHRGNFAVFSDKKENIEKAADGFKPAGAATAREMETKDLAIVGNFKVLGPKLDQMLQAQKEGILGDVEKNVGGNEKMAKYAPLAKVTVSQALWLASQFLKDAQSASFSVNLNKEGIATSLMADFTPGSYFAKVTEGAKNTDASLLAGLPDAKYLLFGGLQLGNEAARKMLDDFLAPIQGEMDKVGGEELRPVVGLIDGIKRVLAVTRGQTVGMIAPTAALGAGSLIQSVVVTTGDAKQMLELQPKLLEAEQKLMAMIPNQPETKITFTPAAKTVDGIEFAQFTSDITGTDAVSMQAKQMLSIMYGPGGPSGFSGVVDADHMLTVQGLDDATISAAIKAVKDKSDSLSKLPGVELVNKNLPQKRVAIGYLALGDFVTTITNYAKMMGMPIPVNIKPDLPPIGFAAATEGPAVHFDSYIPADTVEAMVTTALQLKMMGGGGRGKPGGL
jgi:hypothetical protein